MQSVLPLFLFAAAALVVSGGLVALGTLVGPKRDSPVKQMPYESGMDPVHDARRRFDVRFHLVAIAFLVFDVELLFLYPWAVANRNPEGFDRVIGPGTGQLASSRALVFGEALTFIVLLTVGYVYAWRKGIFRWR